MITRDKLPKNYIPYSALNICSNLLYGGGHVVEINGELPFLIGKGDKPKVWLKAISNAKTKELTVLVENSVSVYSTVEIVEIVDGIMVLLNELKILNVKQNGEDYAEVDFLDLRPLGINIHGDKSVLHVGSSTLSGNTMQGTGVLLGVN